MKKRILSLILVLVLCVTLAPMAGASEALHSKTIVTGMISLAITTNGDLYQWGKVSLSPQKVLSNVSSVTTYDQVVAAITTNGDLYCWGWNDFGAVGHGSVLEQHTPVKVLSNVTSVTGDIRIESTISKTPVTMFAITTSGDLFSWGSNIYGQLGNGKGGKGQYEVTPVKVQTNVASIKINHSTVAALATNGDLYTWGNNKYGQVGNGKTGAVQTTPVKVLSNVASFRTNDELIAAITTNGDLYCWGKNWFGQVGNGAKTHQTTPVKVLSNVASVTTGKTTTAITTSGDLYCWGYTESGQVGNGKHGVEDSQTTPVKVLSNVASVTSTGLNTAAITMSGDLYSWGHNGYGQVGNGKAGFHETTPVKVLSNVASITLDNSLAAAVTNSGDLYCWGSNDSGGVGNGEFGEEVYQTTPVKVLSNVSFAMVAAAVTKNGDLYRWGDNSGGRLGIGIVRNAIEPAPKKVLSNIRLSSTAGATPEVMAPPTAPKVFVDNATLQWDITLDPEYTDGTIKITLKGLVGEQVDKYTVNFASLQDTYFYDAKLGIAGPDYSPNKPGPNVPITGYKVSSGNDIVIAPRNKLAQTIIDFGEKKNIRKITDWKLIPVVEGATMTIELVSGPYFDYDLGWHHAFPGTNPLLLSPGGRQAKYFQMWAGDKAQSFTFKKTTNDEGTFQVYPFSSLFHKLDEDIAFYVVTKAEAKAMIENAKKPSTPVINAIPTGINATPTTSKVLVDGKNVSFDAYNIAGNNYFKLRDFAKAVSGTGKQFAVGYDNATNAITLTSGNAYTAVGGELSKGDGKAKNAVATASKIYVNGKETPFTAYNIGGNNYFKLRDVAKVFNIGVGWDEVTSTITVDTSIGYTE